MNVAVPELSDPLTVAQRIIADVTRLQAENDMLRRSLSLLTQALARAEADTARMREALLDAGLWRPGL